jgi:hypothetical protein
MTTTSQEGTTSNMLSYAVNAGYNATVKALHCLLQCRARTVVAAAGEQPEQHANGGEIEMMEIPVAQQPQAKPKLVKHDRGLYEYDTDETYLSSLLTTLRNRGSHSYSCEERLLVVRAVVLLMYAWVTSAIHLAEHVHEVDTATLVQQLFGAVKPNSLAESQLHMLSVPGSRKVPTWYKACSLTARRLAIREESVKSWVQEYLATGAIYVPSLSRKSLLIETTSSLDVTYVLESLAVVRARRLKGQPTTYKVLQGHLNSDVRLNELCQLDVCPRAIVPMCVLQRALRRTNCITWSKVKRVGRIKNTTEEEIQRRLWRVRVFHAEYVHYALKDVQGTAVLWQMDESFCNQYHCSEESLVEVNDDGSAAQEQHHHAGKGPRLCLVGATSAYGPLVCRDDQGSYVRDHAWVTGAGQHSTASGARFVELNNKGQPRDAYLRRRALVATPKRFAAMNVAQLKQACVDLDVPLPAGSATKVDLVDYLTLLVEQPTMPTPADAAEHAPRESDNAEKLVMEDFTARRASYADQALTTFKVFQANKPTGDYHQNFDSVIFHKWMCAFVLAYPPWCKQMHAQFLNGELPEHVTAGFWDEQRNAPSRTAVLSLDNAPYHKGIAVQLRSKSKKDIAAILRSMHIDSIQFKHFNAETGATVLANAEVPAAGAVWPSGHPNTDQVREGALRALHARDSQLVELPYQRMINEVQDEWGPPGEPGLELVWNAEYISPQIAIELLWAVGKNEVGRAVNQYEGRTLSQVSNILHEAWFADPFALSRKLFGHAHKIMEDAINLDAERNGGPMSGSFPNIQGLPTQEELKEWKQRAGMKTAGAAPLDGEEDDETEEGGALFGVEGDEDGSPDEDEENGDDPL